MMRQPLMWALAAVLGVVGTCCWVLFFHPQWVPQTYEPGRGLTSFKVGVECFIAGMNIVAAGALWWSAASLVPAFVAALWVTRLQRERPPSTRTIQELDGKPRM